MAPSSGTQTATARQLKLAALRLGFDACGIAKADFLEPEARYLEQWLAAGKHGEMTWLANHFDKRVDPRRLVHGARSVVSVIKNYYPAPEPQPAPGVPKISKYAWGEDYHRVLKARLAELLDELRALVGAVSGRYFVDSAPVLDKAWAQRAGLGWVGKHTNLLRQQQGSFFFIGELIVDVPLATDGPVTDHCGTCTRCIDACPTGALTPYEIDARKCISYHTIELRDAPIPDAFKDQLEGWAFGCDICQDVCPWNRHATPHTEPAFKPLEFLLATQPKGYAALSSSQWKRHTRPTALSRVKKEKFLDNLRAAGYLQAPPPAEEPPTNASADAF